MATFDYYYGEESEQFSFYRIPRLLITGSQFKNLSTDAKLLYGLMLDRMSLSRKNGWLDNCGRVYIFYPLNEIQEALNCGHRAAQGCANHTGFGRPFGKTLECDLKKIPQPQEGEGISIVISPFKYIIEVYSQCLVSL